MKRLFLVLLVLCLATPAFAVDEWLKGQPASSASPSDIGTLVQANNEALDRFLAYGRNECKISYSTAAQLTVGVGSVICSNTAGTIRRTRANTSATTVTWSNIDTGAEAVSTTYYVYAVGDADAVTFTIKLSLSATTPTGATYYKRLGYFYNNSSGDIDNTLVINDGHSSRLKPEFGTWASKTVTTIYQADTDGFVIVYGTASNSGYINILTDSNATPTTTRARCGESTHASGPNLTWTLICPVKKDDYYEVTVSGTGNATAIYWLPINLTIE